jgi:hypothetical protein
MTKTIALLLVTFTLFACDRSVAVTNDLTAPGTHGGVRDPSVRPAPVPVVPVGGVRDPSIRPVAPAPVNPAGGVRDPSIRPVPTN